MTTRAPVVVDVAAVTFEILMTFDAVEPRSIIFCNVTSFANFVVEIVPFWILSL